MSGLSPDALRAAAARIEAMPPGRLLWQVNGHWARLHVEQANGEPVSTLTTGGLGREPLAHVIEGVDLETAL